jgi:signal transduction histidine kinase
MEPADSARPGARLAALLGDCREELSVPSPIEGTWDPDRLAQVIQNLLGNALDYSPPDRPVRVTLCELDGEACLSVHNEGPAIPDEARDHLFDPFWQGPQQGRSSKDESLGLGLFIARHIVEAHGGSIEVESREGQGTTFAVRLPRERPPRG